MKSEPRMISASRRKILIFLRLFILGLFLSILHPYAAFAQSPNLVSNPSFENFSSCPSGVWQINRAYWTRPPGHAGTPDYFNSCSGVSPAGVPLNVAGSALAYAGNAYAGARLALPNTLYREYISDTLTAPLQAGAQYRIAIYWRLASLSGYATDDLGIHLSATPVTTGGGFSLGVTPTIHNPSGNFLTTTGSWTEFADTITAVGGEQYITIGAFDSMSTTISSPGGIQLSAYMYYDNASVTILPGITGDTMVCLGDTAQLYAFAINSLIWVDSANPSVVIDTTDTINIVPNQSTTYWCITPNDTFSHTVTVIQPVSNFAQDDTVCLGASSQQILSIDSLPSYSLLWSDGTTDSLFQTNTAGTHWVEISFFGCAFIDTFIITNYPFPDFGLATDTAICSYDSIVLNPNVTANASAGTNVTYSWSNGSIASTIMVNTPAHYWVDISYENCTVRDSIHVAHHPDVTVNLGPDLEFCYLPSYALSANAQNATSYLWSTGEVVETVGVSSSGSYFVTAYGNGCEASDSILLTFYDEPSFDLPDTILYCRLDTALISTGLDPSDLSFLWNVGSNDSIIEVSGGSQGYYWAQVSDSNCTMRDTVYVGMRTFIDLELGNDVITCLGDTTEINPYTSNHSNYTYSYSWNTGATNRKLLVTSPGVYSLTVSDQFCQETDKISVFFFEYPEFSLGEDTVVCASTELQFNVSNPLLNVRYRWYDGKSSPVHTLLAKEDQTIWVSQTFGVCTTIDSLIIDVVSPPRVSLSNVSLLCDGKPATVQAEVDRHVNFMWSDGSTDSTFSTSVSGDHYVIVSDRFCEISHTFYIEQPQVPTAVIDAPKYICFGEKATLDATESNARYYSWNTGSSSPKIEISEPGTYTVEMTHACGNSSDTIVVKDCECAVRFPNAFRPTPSGVNRSFGPAHSCEFKYYELVIYNRWGEAIFKSLDPNVQWDGTYQNQDAPIGSYAYRCVYQGLQDGRVIEQEIMGSVQVLR